MDGRSKGMGRVSPRLVTVWLPFGYRSVTVPLPFRYRTPRSFNSSYRFKTVETVMERWRNGHLNVKSGCHTVMKR